MSAEDDGAIVEDGLTRASKATSVVRPSSRRMVYVGSVGEGSGVAAVDTAVEEKIGTFWMVPQAGAPLRLMLIRVPGGMARIRGQSCCA